ncbi:DegQ family serine endoprotease [Castellaniella defragrans]|uniref:Probable periplasmic serine endoprotease DegP-like n=1 Tax=Castellaniella defragrans TaxID=75697 RepID=A0A7W9TQJ3_CASDE|nr:DegQ family serine endoprotease [Castellaniella defragrans]MBB6084984.1 serine protease Do [Castellaniella defragrans]
MAFHLPYSAVARAAAGAALSLALAAALPIGAAQAQPVAAPSAALPDFTQVVEATEASVVNIRTTEAVPVRRSPMMPGDGDPSELFRWFFGPDFMPPGFGQPNPQGPRGRQRQQPAPSEGERTVPRGIGSGFVISADGYILTNNHVVDNSNGIFVTMTDGKEYKAKVIGTDARTDIALIKIEASGLKPLPIGDSDKLRKGQWVLAIGSPFGLDSTVTAGIVSAINRDTGDYLPFIQTDVAVNPGNSGGPLINLQGQVVGINSQIVSRSGGFMGISLAIPIDEVMRVVEQLKAHGKVTRGRIGVQITEVQDEVAKALGLDKGQGALVSSVEAGGPAAKAGVHPGDVITAFNGQAIKHMTDLPRLVGATRPGTTATVQVWRKGKSLELKATVAELDDKTAAAQNGEAPSSGTGADRLGLTVKALPPDTGEQGVVVDQAEGAAAEAGIEPGDVILRINDADITSPKQYAQIVKDLDKSRPAVLLVSRDQQSQWVIIKPQ